MISNLYFMNNLHGDLLQVFVKPIGFTVESIICPRNTFSAEGRRETFDGECHPCPDGNSSNHLVSDRCNLNAVTDSS